jgi:hypothetical protein
MNVASAVPAADRMIVVAMTVMIFTAVLGSDVIKN